MNIEIAEAKECDKEFVILANHEIDDVSFIKSSKLQQNIDKDIFENHKAVCLVAKVDGKNVGMVLFSKVYWADRGEGIYVSQGYVDKNFRKCGIFKKLIFSALNYFPETKFMTCLVARKNQNMVDCMHKMCFEDEDMISYAKNKEDFDFSDLFMTDL